MPAAEIRDDRMAKDAFCARRGGDAFHNREALRKGRTADSRARLWHGGSSVDAGNEAWAAISIGDNGTVPVLSDGRASSEVSAGQRGAREFFSWWYGAGWAVSRCGRWRSRGPHLVESCRAVMSGFSTGGTSARCLKSSARGT
jgi:hypothetical protein